MGVLDDLQREMANEVEKLRPQPGDDEITVIVNTAFIDGMKKMMNICTQNVKQIEGTSPDVPKDIVFFKVEELKKLRKTLRNEFNPLLSFPTITSALLQQKLIEIDNNFLGEISSLVQLTR